MQSTFSTAQRGVRAAFELSWQELEPLTQRVAQFLSLFRPNVIPWELVAVSSDAQLLNWAKTDTDLAKKQLYKIHFIQRLEERDACYEIHSLIQKFLQYKLQSSEQSNTLEANFLVAIKAYYRKLAYEILEQNINNIEGKVAEEFQELEFSESWRHPLEIDRLDDLEEITVRVNSVEIIKTSLLNIDNIDDEYSQFKYELSLKIVFTPEGSYPDFEMSYYDSEEGEVVFLNTILEVGGLRTEIVTAKVGIIFDADDPFDRNAVEVEYVELVDAPTEVKMSR